MKQYLFLQFFQEVTHLYNSLISPDFSCKCIKSENTPSSDRNPAEKQTRTNHVEESKKKKKIFESDVIAVYF